MRQQKEETNELIETYRVDYPYELITWVKNDYNNLENNKVEIRMSQ